MGLYLLLLLSQGDYAGFHTLLEGLEVAARGLAVEGEGESQGDDAKMKGAGDEGGASTTTAKANPLEDDEFIQYPIRLEQALMEGSYDRVWGETKDERVPSEEYKVFSKVSGELHFSLSLSLYIYIYIYEEHFSLCGGCSYSTKPLLDSYTYSILKRTYTNNAKTQVLVGTIRSEIASCSEYAYASLPITNAKNLFFLDSEGAVVQFANERGWTVRDGRIYFPHNQSNDDAFAVAGSIGGAGTERDGILAASKQVIDNTISYARELETIV